MMMFTKAKNIEAAFRQARRAALIAITGSILFCGLCLYKSLEAIQASQKRIYVLSSGKVLEALSSERRQNLPVELRDHVKVFHQDFFSLEPDEQAIQATIAKALYLADGSAKSKYDDLLEQGFYRKIVSGNISQRLMMDSIILNMTQEPYHFRYYGKQRIVRPTSLVIRSLVSQGRLRQTARSEHNPHGFLIERWRILENEDIEIKRR